MLLVHSIDLILYTNATISKIRFVFMSIMRFLALLTHITRIKITDIIFCIFSLCLIIWIKSLLSLMCSALCFLSISIWSCWFEIVDISRLYHKIIRDRCFITILLIVWFNCFILWNNTLLQLPLLNWTISNYSLIIVGRLLDLLILSTLHILIYQLLLRFIYFHLVIWFIYMHLILFEFLHISNLVLL